MRSSWNPGLATARGGRGRAGRTNTFATRNNHTLIGCSQNPAVWPRARSGPSVACARRTDVSATNTRSRYHNGPVNQRGEAFGGPLRVRPGTNIQALHAQVANARGTCAERNQALAATHRALTDDAAAERLAPEMRHRFAPSNGRMRAHAAAHRARPSSPVSMSKAVGRACDGCPRRLEAPGRTRPYAVETPRMSPIEAKTPRPPENGEIVLATAAPWLACQHRPAAAAACVTDARFRTPAAAALAADHPAAWPRARSRRFRRVGYSLSIPPSYAGFHSRPAPHTPHFWPSASARRRHATTQLHSSVANTKTVGHFVSLAKPRS